MFFVNERRKMMNSFPYIYVAPSPPPPSVFTSLFWQGGSPLPSDTVLFLWRVTNPACFIGFMLDVNFQVGSLKMLEYIYSSSRGERTKIGPPIGK